MSYTIWLIPKEEKVRAYLTSIIKNLAQKYDGPQFEPHSTLLGDIQLPFNDIQNGCKKIIENIKPFTVETGSVEYSTTYYQCLFVRVKPNPKLMILYDLAKQVFGMVNPSVFTPHISLFYGNIPYSTRHEMMKTIIFEPQQYSIDSLIVTPGGEHPPSEWEHILTVPFFNE
jgi:2'-5' RNA ligase